VSDTAEDKTPDSSRVESPWRECQTDKAHDTADDFGQHSVKKHLTSLGDKGKRFITRAPSFAGGVVSSCFDYLLRLQASISDSEIVVVALNAA
jgi:hypothetical protein